MAFVVGPLSGAVVAGGIYYGFSNLISKRTEQHQRDLRRLTLRLHETPTYIHAPPPASSRIIQHDFSTTLKNTWNQEVAFLAAGLRAWGKQAAEWGRVAREVAETRIVFVELSEQQRLIFGRRVLDSETGGVV